MSIYNYRYHRTHFQIYTIPIFESFARSNIPNTEFLFIYPAATDYIFLKAIWKISSMFKILEKIDKISLNFENS